MDGDWINNQRTVKILLDVVRHLDAYMHRWTGYLLVFSQPYSFSLTDTIVDRMSGVGVVGVSSGRDSDSIFHWDVLVLTVPINNGVVCHRPWRASAARTVICGIRLRQAEHWKRYHRGIGGLARRWVENSAISRGKQLWKGEKRCSGVYPQMIIFVLDQSRCEAARGYFLGFDLLAYSPQWPVLSSSKIMRWRPKSLATLTETFINLHTRFW